jgi:hypothetical protein
LPILFVKGRLYEERHVSRLWLFDSGFANRIGRFYLTLLRPCQQSNRVKRS